MEERGRHDVTRSVINSTLSLRALTFLLGVASPGLAPAAPADDEFLREMIRYSEALEQRILAEGRPLTDAEKELARRADIQDVDRVRLLVLDSVPLPESRILRQRLAEIGLLRLIRSARGTAKGYGIILTPAGLGQPSSLAHELVHVGQYERLGGIAPLMKRHLPDLTASGYRSSVLEDEAYRLAPEIVNSTTWTGAASE